jgi:hypothetical protein
VAKQAFFSSKIPDSRPEGPGRRKEARIESPYTLPYYASRGGFAVGIGLSLFASYIQNTAHNAPISHKLTIDGPFDKIIIYARNVI